MTRRNSGALPPTGLSSAQKTPKTPQYNSYNNNNNNNKQNNNSHRSEKHSLEGLPQKVTTLDQILQQSSGNFCGQTTRRSHDGVFPGVTLGGIGGSDFMSKSFSGGRNLLDSHRQERLQSAGSPGMGLDDRDGRTPSKPKSQRAPKRNEKRYSTGDVSPEHSEPPLEEYPEALRREINGLQQALVDKFRGHNKVVGGAQFRASTQNGNQKCELCESKDNSLKKAKETIRSLRFQLSQAEDKLYGKITGEAVQVPQHDSVSSRELAMLREENEALLTKLHSSEQKVSELTRLLEEERQWRRSNDSGEDAAKLRLELDESKRKCDDLHEASIEHNKMLLQLKEQLNLKCAYVVDLEKALEELREAAKNPKTPEKSRELAQKLLNEEELCKKLRKELDVLRKQYHDQKMESELEGEELLRLAAEHKQQLEKLDLASSTISTLEKEAQDFASQLAKSRQEDSNARDVMQKLQKEIEALKTELSRKSRRVDDLESDLVSVRSDADSANSKMNTMLRKMTEESENSSKAIQKAISSSVRLCVVAPTVNVHVADKKMKFRTNIPKEELEVFLKDRVLSKYTFLFEQSKENMGPDGRCELQPWIKKVLAEMQQSVENHISSAMKNGSNS